MNYDFRSAVPSRPQVGAGLRLGEQAQLVHPLKGESDTWHFKHALVQEAAYTLLTRHERKRLHQLTAWVLESGAGSQLDELSTQLAWHYSLAGDNTKASEYHIRAADVATRTFALPEARLHYQSALEILAKMGDATEVMRMRIDTANKYAAVAYRVDAPPQLFARMKDVEALADALPKPRDWADRARLAHLHRWLSVAAAMKNDFSTSLAYSYPLLQECQELGLEELFAQVSADLGSNDAVLGNFGKAVALLEAALPILEIKQDWMQWLYVARHLGLALAGVGELERARELTATCLRRGREMQNNAMTAVGYTNLGFIYWMTGEGTRLLQNVQKTNEMESPNRETLSMIIGHALEALAYSRLGRQEQAHVSIAHEEQAALQFGGEQFFQVFVLPIRTEIAYNLSDYAEAIMRAQETIAFAQPLGGIWAVGIAERVWAQSVARMDPACIHDVDKHFAESLGAFARGQAVLEAARTHLEWAKVFILRGAKDAARGHLAKAAAQYEKSGLADQLKEARVLLNKLNA